MSQHELADTVRFYKTNPKGVEIMRSIQDEIEKEGAYKKAVDAAKKLLELNKLTYDEIAKVIGLTIEEVKALDMEASA